MISENSYFDGGVKSLGFAQKSTDSPVTTDSPVITDSSVGVMAPGQYTFGTVAAERMTVVKGTLTIKRLSDLEWHTYQSGQAFEVEAESSFDVKVDVATAYLCEYL
ncbi:pyrimidine/purine nucleoside phosphorylase [Vibrio sp. FNV 38]|nr:pyrimidine/purine nucleoside phosphorylase [Vibrio sp. FNV 38]